MRPSPRRDQHMKPLLTIPVLAGFLLAPAPPPSSAKVTVPGQDSIYTLAVKPADHPDDAVAFLLDEGIYRIEADGRVKNTTRMVVQILKPEGAKAYQEQRFSWNPERQRQTVNWMRIVKPSGEVVSEHPEQIQESDVPAAMGTPMYTATKVRRMSLSGLEPGTILDYSVTTESDPHMMPGEFAISWRVTPAVPVVKSNLVVDVPAALNPRIVEKNLDFKRRESVSNGRKVYTWAPAKVPRVKMERFAPDSLSPVMTVSVTPPIRWTTIGEWYAPIARQAYTIKPSVEAKMFTVLAG